VSDSEAAKAGSISKPEGQ